MTLKFNITQEEYTEFTKHFYKKALTGNWKMYVGIAVVLIAFNLYTSTSRHDFESENGEGTSISYTSSILNWLFFIALFGGLWWFILKRISKNKLKSNDSMALLAEREMIFEEDKVQLNMQYSETTYRWGAFQKFDQNSNLYFLYIASNMAVLIPKRVFENPQQQAEFEALVKRKMPDSSKMEGLKNPNVLDA
jgi:hypothetical protein